MSTAAPAVIEDKQVSIFFFFFVSMDIRPANGVRVVQVVQTLHTRHVVCRVWPISTPTARPSCSALTPKPSPLDPSINNALLNTLQPLLHKVSHLSPFTPCLLSGV